MRQTRKGNATNPERFPMQRLIHAVTALSVGLYVVPPFSVTPVMAEGTSTETTSAGLVPLVLPEGAFTVELDGETVICLPDKALECPEGSFCVVARKEAGCLKKAEAKKAQEALDAANAATVEPTGATEAAPSEPAPEQATGPAPAEPASGDQASTDQATAEPTATEPAPEPAPEPATAPADQTAPSEGQSSATTAPDATVTEGTSTEATVTEGASSEVTSTSDAGTAAQTEAGVAGPAGARLITIGDAQVWCLPKDPKVTCPEGSICVRPKKMENCEAAARGKLKQLAVAAAEDKAALDAAKKAADEAAAAAAAAEAAGQALVDAPQVSETAVQSLDQAIAAPADAVSPATPPAAAAVAAAATESGKPPASQPPAPDAVVTEQKVTAADTRASSQEFAAAPAATADRKKKTGLSDLEKVGLLALGALVVGDILAGNNEVVSNTGDRVVVKDPQGNYQVYKDDDVLLRQPGANVRTETFSDGSTRTTVLRDDGTSVVTIRDASGRVLRRSAYDARGIETVLINDTLPEQRVDVTRLPPPVYSGGQQASDADLAAALAAIDAQTAGQRFSLRQIRTIPEVKALAAPIPVDNVTFETGSAAIRPDQAENLAALGRVVKKMIAKNPNRVFLIEGHTDAVGGAALNLKLSDRRAESLAKALTEYFGVPPENLVVQGYGESELLIDTELSERANRRVVVRDITPLLRQQK